MKVSEKLTSLRNLMQQNQISVYLVIGSDPHASEYMAEHWMEMSWISGFLGETGTAVITAKEALLWTDSRYYIQAEKELQGSTFQLMRASDIDCPSINQWLIQSIGAAKTKKVGVNAQMYSSNQYVKLEAELAENNIQLVNIDLIAPIWTENRPIIPQSLLEVYDDMFSGEPTDKKLERIRQKMNENGCDTMLVSALDELGWLLNIRGFDVLYTPCLVAYCVLEMQQCTLFVDKKKIDDKAQKYLEQCNVTTMPYESIYNYLRNLQNKHILYDGNRTNHAMIEAVKQNNTLHNISPSPILVAMSIKNEIEIEGVRKAMIRDGVALTKFFLWLENKIIEAEKMKKDGQVENLYEISLAEKLHEFRKEQQNFREESFCTIPAIGPNGAIVHYHADKDHSAPVLLNNLLLLDSGGQYLDGTTDITRTIWLGHDLNQIPQQLKHDFTLVLKGHIALAQAVFPEGTRGNQLDVLAHQFMWKEGITYTHGTGHGVGHFMGCHEGPQNIRTDNNPNPLRLGNICSDEPGIYRENQYGIRTENLVLVIPDDKKEHSTGENYYRFETLTWCFYDTRLIDTSMLTIDEKNWLNDYHKQVFKHLADLLDDKEKLFLQQKCQEV